MRKTALYIFIFFTINLIAQDRTIDSLKLALKNAKHDTTRCDILSFMSEVYKKQGQGMQSLAMYKLYVQMKDSVKNKEDLKAAFKKETQYKYDKQRLEDSVATAKSTLVKNVEIEKQKTELNAKKKQQCFLFGGLILVISFAGFMYNRFKITQKQKQIIEEQKTIVEKQKDLVEEKQKEILDSINYAKRIQTAFLPSEKYIQRKLQENIRS